MADKTAVGNALPPCRPAVFLDRDGVLIRTFVRDGKPFAVTRPEEVALLDGVEAACDALTRAGFLLVMVTNQPDVARGKVSKDFVEAVNSRLAAALGLDSVRVCYHDDGDGCDCRKPKPGLITHAAADLAIDLDRSTVVGDRWRDIEAGRGAGCRTVLIGNGYNEMKDVRPDHAADTLWDAVPWIRSSTIPLERS